MRDWIAIPNVIRRVAGVAVVILAGPALGANSPAAAQEIDTYEWSAVLMGVNESNNTAEFQARFETYADIDGLDRFSDGDRLTLVWTGRMWAAGVRDLAADPDVEPTALTLPVEFVSTARDDAYLNFRISVPDDAIEQLVAMGEGARVTVFSPRTGADWESAVVSLRHYNDVS